MAGPGRQMKVRPADCADHAAILGFGIEDDRANTARVAAEHDGCSRVTLAGARVSHHSDVRIAESLLIKGIEDAEAPGFFVVPPVMAVGIGQVLLEPGQHRRNRARVQDMLAAEHIHAEWPGRH